MGLNIQYKHKSTIFGTYATSSYKKKQTRKINKSKKTNTNKQTNTKEKNQTANMGIQLDPPVSPRIDVRFPRYLDQIKANDVYFHVLKQFLDLCFQFSFFA